MPSPFILSLLLYSILFLKVCCIPTDAGADASADLDSSSPQQQPPAVDFDYNYSPSTNFLASNNANLDSTTLASITDTTYGINNNDLGSSSQQELPEEQVNVADDNGDDDGFGSRFKPPSSTGPLLLLSSDGCEKSQNGDVRQPNARRAHRKRKDKRQLRNCPNPYLTNPIPPANSIKTQENDDEDYGRTMRGEGGRAPTMAIPGLILQQKPEPNLSLCPDVERPIPVCAREDIKVPMGDSFLIPKCHACKFFFFFGGLGGGEGICIYIYIFFSPYTFRTHLQSFQSSNAKIPSHLLPPSALPRPGRWGGEVLGRPTYRYSIRRL